MPKRERATSLEPHGNKDLSAYIVQNLKGRGLNLNMTKDNKNWINQTVEGTRKALEFISRGKVTIEITDEGFRLIGDEVGAKLLGEYSKNRPRGLSKILDYFDWPYERSSKDKICGEGVVAYSLFEWLMADHKDEINKLVRDEILPKLVLNCKV